MFPDKVKIPARKAKIFFGITLCISIWSIYQIRKAKEFIIIKGITKKHEIDRVAPFSEALS